VVKAIEIKTGRQVAVKIIKKYLICNADKKWMKKKKYYF